MQDPTETILCPLRAAALAAPDATAIVSAHRAISYVELDRMVSATTRRLLETGCGPGVRVALYLPGDEWYIVLLLALLRAGCVSCPLSTRLPSEGVSRMLGKAACSVLISEDEELLGRISSEVHGILPEALLGGEDGDTAHPAYLPLGRPATVVFTSGSTGGPKAALHTFGNHYYSALGSNANIALSAGDRWLLSLPLYHVGGLSILFRCLLAGAAIALPEPGLPLDRSISELGVTHVSLVATQLRRLLETRTETSNLKAALLGGGPTPEALVKEAVARGVPVYTSYGLTEMASQV
ncbi:MAG: AMP-binding protein, partial [Rubrobacteraceae bacterium]